MENITLLLTVKLCNEPAQAIRQIKESAARIIIVFAGPVAARNIMCQVYLQNAYGPRHQWLFWNKQQYFNVPKKKYLDTGCSKQQVLHACNYLIMFSPAKPSKEDDDTIAGDSGYTTNQLRQKFSEYLDHSGYEQSVLSTRAFDAIWVAAKTLNASIERLQPNEAIDQFSYDNSSMTKIFFDSLTKLKFEGASPVRDAHLTAFVVIVMLVDVVLLVAWQISDPIVVDLFNIKQEVVTLHYVVE
ncbi:hypothetical protein LSAT2_026749 [Lamellibrachia satsuma]|nr:hypothetical protein LSAT2_026749 [Lamellibrachia satsuma]